MNTVERARACCIVVPRTLPARKPQRAARFQSLARRGCLPRRSFSGSFLFTPERRDFSAGGRRTQHQGVRSLSEWPASPFARKNGLPFAIARPRPTIAGTPGVKDVRDRKGTVMEQDVPGVSWWRRPAWLALVGLALMVAGWKLSVYVPT